MKLDYCHLHLHTEYSTLDGLGTTKEYAERASELGFKHLGCTDHGNIDGLIKFQKACSENEILPILGSELYIIPELEKDERTKKERKRGHICVFAKNQKGFTNICQMLTFANSEGFYYKPRVTYKILLDHCEGLVISTACMASFLRMFKSGEKFFGDLYESIGKDLYCEIMPHNTKQQIETNKLKIKIAKRFGCKIILTNDCHYVMKQDHKAQEVLLSIQRKAKWDDKNRFRFNIKGLHLRSTKEMIRAIKKIGFFREEYFLNTIEVAEKCSQFTISKMEVKLPRVKGVPTNSKKEKKFLLNLCKKGFKEKFNQPIEDNEIYSERLDEEYSLITEKKFHRYFLIVWEFVEWCKKKEIDIFIGPGRGSVGGSLMAYLLGITSVDPIKHNLIFSRFINKDRIDYPDIDIDFEHEKRHLIREHLESLYGQDKVAGVSSFNRMKSKAVIKDVGKVFGIPYGEVNEFTKLIEDNDEHTGIQLAIDSDEGRSFADKYPEVIKYAKALEGQIRGKSKHAAALVLSKENIGAGGRCYILKDKDESMNVNWEKEDTEYVGLMKIDILGLKLLSILAETRMLIEENHNKKIDFESIDLEDKKVLKEISEGNTVGVFQLGTYAMTTLIKEMGVEKFQHISDAVALVRPGPAQSGQTEEYIKRKHGAKWNKKHKIYEEVTKDTYGIITYQEDVINVINKVAGLPYSEADKIRKVISKKRDVKAFAPYKKQFIEGCLKNKTLTRREAKEFWTGLEKHAHYSFVKAHAVEYSILAFWCSWAKKYYPTEFICASLTHGAKTKKKELVEEAYRLGLNIMLPKVGQSHPIKWVAKGKNLYAPFIEVKGIGKVKAIEAATYPCNLNTGIKTYFSCSKKEGTATIHKGELGLLLKKIGAYDNEEKSQIDEEVKKYFEFRISSNPQNSYKNLFEVLGGKIRIDRINSLLNIDFKVAKQFLKNKNLITKVKFKGHKKIMSCRECILNEEATRPVPPSPGKINVVCVAEAPGPREDEIGEGLVGKSGEKAWNAIGKKKYPRELFHISNVAKCYPSKSGKPSYEQMKLCGKKFLQKELDEVKPILILALGGTPLYFFTGQKSGIRNMSGKVQWFEEYSAWIVWCMHPAATLHNPDNQPYFDSGIKSFKKMLKILGV